MKALLLQASMHTDGTNLEFLNYKVRFLLTELSRFSQGKTKIMITNKVFPNECYKIL